MNTKRANTTREKEGVANEKFSLHVDQVPIGYLANVNEGVPPPKPQRSQGPQMSPMPQAPQAPFVEGDMTNAELRAFLINLTQLMMAQAQVVTNYLVGQGNQGDRSRHNVSTPASRIRYFMRMNPPNFHGTKVDKDPQSFIDEIFKVIYAMV